MGAIRFAVLGGGWRSQFYTRIANAAPDLFQLKGIWIHNAEKAVGYNQKFNVPVMTRFEDMLKLSVDFFVLCLPWEENMEYSKRLIAMGYPVLTETPAAPDIKGLNDFWTYCISHSAKIQIGEEYHLQPYHASVINLVKNGFIGTPTHVSISMMHGYHCANVARQLLQVGMEKCEVHGERFKRKIAKTCDRFGEYKKHPLLDVEQQRITIAFESGKTWFYDFCGEQYFSLIRSASLWLCAEKGDVLNNTVKFINSEGNCLTEELHRVDLGIYGNLQSYSHRGFSFQGKWIYENPVPGISLTDDEIAVAANLMEMKRYLVTGEQQYTLSDACQDSYLSFVMQEAIDSGKPMITEKQNWNC